MACPMTRPRTSDLRELFAEDIVVRVSGPRIHIDHCFLSRKSGLATVCSLLVPGRSSRLRTAWKRTEPLSCLSEDYPVGVAPLFVIIAEWAVPVLARPFRLRGLHGHPCSQARRCIKYPSEILFPASNRGGTLKFKQVVFLTLPPHNRSIGTSDRGSIPSTRQSVGLLPRRDL